MNALAFWLFFTLNHWKTNDFLSEKLKNQKKHRKTNVFQQTTTKNQKNQQNQNQTTKITKKPLEITKKTKKTKKK